MEKIEFVSKPINGIITLPKEALFLNNKEITVSVELKSRESKNEIIKRIRGALHKHADKKLRTKENTAWEEAVKEKYENRGR